uniref:Glucosylceramidase n=1 Tax=Acrobeloides nanus TaxID=290746 RepID=A0A914EEL2_9BILA
MTILADSEASKYVDGTAVHWYDDLPWDPASKLSDLYLAHSDKFILSTEACNGWLDPPLQGPSYGNWYRGASYANDIIIGIANDKRIIQYH